MNFTIWETAETFAGDVLRAKFERASIVRPPFSVTMTESIDVDAIAEAQPKVSTKSDTLDASLSFYAKPYFHSATGRRADHTKIGVL
jgi:hypothetical protein